MEPRAAGLLLHPTSLPGAYGIGDLGPESVAFCDFLRAAGQSVWQILPLGPTHGSGAPYSSLSAFAGNPILISPERLLAEGLLSEEAARAARPGGDEARVDLAEAGRVKERLVREAWARFHSGASADLRRELEAFRAEPRIALWLPDWALYAALRERFERRTWTLWDRELRDREQGALACARRELADEIAYREFEQFLFFRQWRSVRGEATRHGIRILGDLPMYTAPDSADVWIHRELFALDREGRPEKVAGVPPDYFSEDGQLWGNPLYRWDRLREDGYSWWIARLGANLELFDLVRLDHFRGLVAYWEVAASESSARPGAWVEGPGSALLEAARRELGSLPLVAEDLGTITPAVRELREAFGLPGMKVLQFAFSEEDSDHLPHHHVPQSVVYTGTHDNDTARGWFAGLAGPERGRLADYLGSDGRSIAWDLLRCAYASVARTAIVPVQDVLGLGSEARMNVPGSTAGNWAWRVGARDLTDERAARLHRQATLAGRVPCGT